MGFECFSRLSKLCEGLDGPNAYVAEMVGQFNKIHPFVNGNGRMGRLLLKWALSRYGLKCVMPTAARPTPVVAYNEAMSEASAGKPEKLALFILASIKP